MTNTKTLPYKMQTELQIAIKAHNIKILSTGINIKGEIKILFNVMIIILTKCQQ
jgi:hypothetical protein